MSEHEHEHEFEDLEIEDGDAEDVKGGMGIGGASAEHLAKQKAMEAMQKQQQAMAGPQPTSSTLQEAMLKKFRSGMPPR